MKDRPEHYLVVPKDETMNIDAINCVLARAKSVCLMLADNFVDEPHFASEVLENACWTLEGMMKEIHVLVNGSEA